MSLHTRVFASSTLVVAVLACTLVALDLPTALNFTGAQTEMLRQSFVMVPILTLISALCAAFDLIER